MLLAGDVGGTKTDLAIFTPDKGPRFPIAQDRFHSANYSNLEAMVKEFLASKTFPVTDASFAVAGPVVGGHAQLTNLPWYLDETTLRDALTIRTVRLLNDVEAIANAVPHLQPVDLYTLNVGTPVAGSAIAVIAPGTGLGEAFLTWDGETYHAHPSEGGHTDFAPTCASEIELLRYMKKHFKHVSCERICSGSGIPNIYDFLKQSGVATESPDLAARLAVAEDRTPLIVQAAQDSQLPCDLCATTIRLFIAILGAEAGNLTLKVLATGGLYLGGGIPPRILPYLTNGRFIEAFHSKGRLTELLTHVPIHVIMNRVALIGAAGYGLRQMHAAEV